MALNRPDFEQLANAADFDEKSLHGLLRALNTRRTIAFLGSGVSIPYGASTWDEMIARIGAEARRELDRHLRDDARQRSQAVRPVVREKMKRLKHTLDHFDTDPTDDADRARPAPSRSELNLAQLELYQLALDLVAQAHEDLQVQPGVHRDAPKPFHELIGEMFRSDLFPAQEKATRRLNDLAVALSGRAIEPGRVQPDEPTAPSIHPWLAAVGPNLALGGKQRFYFQNLYSIRTLERLKMSVGKLPDVAGAKNAGEFLGRACGALLDDAARAHKDANTNGLPPDRRSFFGLVFATLAAELGANGVSPETGRSVFAGLADELAPAKNEPGQALLPPDKLPQRFTPEAAGGSTEATKFQDGEMTFEELRPRNDLIERILRNLQFWRVLTTNYDDEVERYLERLNYPRGTLSARQYMNQTFKEQVDPETGRRSSRSFLGRSAASDVLTKNSVAHLIDLATRSHDVGARVLHLHGRADRPETIIATESDYQRLYMGNSRHRQSFENALHIVFSGNPVLFIGSGLQEQDLQRPLREFVSNRGGEDRELFALLPALHREDSLLWSKIENYLRYGVRVLFYGEEDREKELGQALDNAASRREPAQEIDYRALQLAPLNRSIGAHIRALSALADDLTAAVDAVRTHLGDLQDADKLEAATKALERAEGRFGKSGSGPVEPDQAWRLHVPDALQFLLGEDSLDSFFAPDKAVISAGSKAVRGFIDAGLQALKAKPQDAAHAAHMTALSATLELYCGYTVSLQSDLISGTLNNALDQLRALRGRWWRDSQGKHERRTARLLDDGKARTKVSYRHPVVWPYDGPDEENDEAERFAATLLKLPRKRDGALVIVRGRPGDGKGNFYRAVSKALIAKGADAKAQSRAWYDYAWYSNVSHSLEFSAILAQVADVIAHVTVKALHAWGEPRKTVKQALKDYGAANGRIALIDHCIDLIQTRIANGDDPAKAKRAIILLCGFDAFFSARGNALTVEIEQFCRILGRLGGAGGLFDVVIVATDEDRIASAVTARWQTPPVRAGAPRPTSPEFELHEVENFEEGLTLLGRIYGKARKSRRRSRAVQPVVVAPLPVGPRRSSNQPRSKSEDPDKELDSILAAYHISKTSYVASLLRKTLKTEEVWSPPAPNTHGRRRREVAPSDEEIQELKVRWLRQIESSLVRTSPESHRFRIFDRVLEQYGMRTDDPNGALDTESRIDFLVMKTIAFFGCPIEGAVLLRAHELRNYLRDRVQEAPHTGADTNQTGDRGLIMRMARQLEDSLGRLLRRGLLGAIAYDDGERARAALGDALAPSQTRPQESDLERTRKLARLSSGARFILHPKMKHFIASQYAYRAPDQGFTNTFVLTMYAAQPIDVALMNPDVQRTVDNLIDDLVQAWRVLPIASMEELAGDGFGAAPVERWQRVLLEHVALGLTDKTKLESALEAACGSDAAAKKTAEEARRRLNSDGLGVDNLFRAKTFRGLLARGSADMSACFRGAYSVVRQLRPFSVLARMDPAAPSDTDASATPPFDLIALRLRHLIQGMNSSDQARDIASTLAAVQDDTSLDTKLAGQEGEPHPINTFGPPNNRKPALYSHELAWIWNERGVIALAQGKMYDALPFFNEAVRVIAEHDGVDSALSSGAARIKVNIAASWIERGSLRRAEEILHTVLRTCGEQRFPELDDPPWEEEGGSPARDKPVPPQHPVRQFVRPVAIGYLGLIHHLKGDVKLAMEHYKRAIAALERHQQNRAISIFSKHWADALATRNNAEAEAEIRRAISTAQSMMQIDQLHYCYLARVRQLLQDGCSTADQDEARKLIHAVQDYALKMGLPRLTCEALFFDAKLKGLQGQLGPAVQAASEAVAIAAKQGMKIRRISCSILLGELICRNGDHKTGRRLLEEAGEAAQRIGYQLAVERQQKAMHQLGL